MNLSDYDHKLVQITDTDGRVFTGTVEMLSSEYCFHEFGREEDGLQMGEYVFYASGIAKIAVMSGLAVIRAAETWQQAGAYYVRIQAMAKKHHITLREEFDEHDTPETKYIVVTQDDFPIATARLYPVDKQRMMIGRGVVLPEYRHMGIGSMTVLACETWAKELGFCRIVLESRENKTAFYEQLGYAVCGEAQDGDTFRCIRMEKEIV